MNFVKKKNNIQDITDFIDDGDHSDLPGLCSEKR